MSKLTNKLNRLIKKYKEIIQHNEGFCRLPVVAGAQYHISQFSIINAWKNIAELGAGNNLYQGNCGCSCTKSMKMIITCPVCTGLKSRCDFLNGIIWNFKVSS